jgi:hypothetical protein
MSAVRSVVRWVVRAAVVCLVRTRPRPGGMEPGVDISGMEQLYCAIEHMRVDV